jgi:hypothetical protein
MNDFKHWFDQKNKTYERNWLNLKVREDIDANTFRHEFEAIKDEYNTLRGIYNTNNNPEWNLPEPIIPRLYIWRGIGEAPHELMLPPPPIHGLPPLGPVFHGLPPLGPVFHGLPPLGPTDGILFHGVPLQGKRKSSKRKNKRKNKRKSNKRKSK